MTNKIKYKIKSEQNIDMIGGELVKGSIDITHILENTVYNVDEQRTNAIDDNVVLGRGFQGKIVALKNDLSKVAKMIKIKDCTVSKETKEVIFLHLYASEIHIGPQIYGTPFITTDCNYVVFIMDKILPYKPLPQDDAELIQLFTTSFTHHFVPFDFEYAKRDDGQIIFLDFGVCGLYSSYKEALQKAIDNDVFLYKDFLQTHFLNEMKQLGGKSKRKQRRTRKRKQRRHKSRRH